jgi:transglutaminase-like putative cysteine protease
MESIHRPRRGLSGLFWAVDNREDPPVPFQVVHRTRYAYDAPVRPGRHRLMLRPRDSHDLRLLNATLSIAPQANVEWRHDVFGDSIGLATFTGETTELAIQSRLLIERFPLDLDHAERRAARAWPFVYDGDDRADLGALAIPERLEDEEAVMGWVRERLGDPAAHSATDLLYRPSETIHGALAYAAREAEGAQSARATIERGSGTCRDYAQLMIEAARALGYGARFVTGYLHSPALDDGAADGRATVGAAATHAWAEVYAPDEGWIAFDPTNNAIESRDLIRVAAVRTARQASPVSGGFRGAAASTMDVTVEIAEATGSPDGPPA